MVYCAMKREGGPASHEAGYGEVRENVLDVLLAPAVAVDWSRLTRNVFTSSSCGICSKASIEAVRGQFLAITETWRPTRAVLAALPERLRVAQAGFAATGGLHASGLFSKGGALIVAREDVGRHNALDKLMGAMARTRQSTAEGALLLTSRASYEMVQKAAWCGVAIVVAVSAPTALAIAIAAHAHITLIGLARDGRYVAYTHPSRIRDYAAPSE